MNGKITLPEEAYTGKEPDITNIRIQGSKVYKYVNPKTLYKDNRHNKLVLRGREGVFIGYLDNTKKYLKIYTPDLRYTIFSSKLFINELVSGGIIDL